MEVAEDFLGPQVNAAFAGISDAPVRSRRFPAARRTARSEISHSQTVTPPLAAMAGDYVEVENGNHEQQHQIEAPEDALEIGMVVRRSIRILERRASPSVFWPCHSYRWQNPRRDARRSICRLVRRDRQRAPAAQRPARAQHLQTPRGA